MAWVGLLCCFCWFVAAASERPCSVSPGNKLPFCDVTLPLAKRVSDLVGRLTDLEKVGLFDNTATGVEKFHIPPYQWWSEALHGVGISPGVEFIKPTPAATSFPQVCLTGASFNSTLWRAIGTAIGDEGRAMSNVHRAGLTFWAPNINIFRDPRWGRGQETVGEDPYLTSAYAEQYVRGMQEGPDSKYLKVSSCCKHYFDYNLENWEGHTRHNFNAITTQQDLSDTFLPAFQSCVQRGHASSLMCSYNAVNGVPSCANKEFMTTTARKDWGFEGYITSDCGAVDDVLLQHHYTKGPSETVKLTLEAGMDNDCGVFIPLFLLPAMAEGAVSNATVDAALHNLFSVQFRLGMFDPPANQPYLQYNISRVNSPQHQQLALEAARQGIVLLHNSDKRLPLSGAPHVALIGPNANVTLTLQGNYEGIAPYLISPYEGIKAYAPHTTVVKGCNNVACKDTTGFKAATDAAAAADVVVMVIGLDQSQEREAHDRTSLALPGQQEALVTAVATASKSPIVVVVMSGGHVDLTGVKNNPKVASIVWCGYPGQSGGQALADVLFGTVNPAGRLVSTMYPADFVKVPMTTINMRPNTTIGYPGRTYRFYTGQAVYPFGSGLSYTTFHYSTTQHFTDIPATSAQQYIDSAGPHAYLSSDSPQLTSTTITVTNTGTVPGADVVLFFITPPHPGQDGSPLKSLGGFKRVYLLPGQSVKVTFGVTAHQVGLVDYNGVNVVRRGTWVASFGEPSKINVPFVVA